MSVGVIAAVVSILCAGVLWAWTRNNADSAGAMVDPTGDGAAGRWTFVVRVEGDDEGFARSILKRSSSKEDHLMDFIRLVPSATHFYGDEWTRSVRCDLPGGVLVRVDASHPTSSVKTLGEVLLLLRGLGAAANPQLSIVESDPAGTPLRAADDATRPGHHQCEYCFHSYVLHELECPSCGAPRRA